MSKGKAKKAEKEPTIVYPERAPLAIAIVPNLFLFGSSEFNLGIFKGVFGTALNSKLCPIAWSPTARDILFKSSESTRPPIGSLIYINPGTNASVDSSNKKTSYPDDLPILTDDVLSKIPVPLRFNQWQTLKGFTLQLNNLMSPKLWKTDKREDPTILSQLRSRDMKLLEFATEPALSIAYAAHAVFFADIRPQDFVVFAKKLVTSIGTRVKEDADLDQLSANRLGMYRSMSGAFDHSAIYQATTWLSEPSSGRRPTTLDECIEVCSWSVHFKHAAAFEYDEGASFSVTSHRKAEALSEFIGELANRVDTVVEGLVPFRLYDPNTFTRTYGEGKRVDFSFSDMGPFSTLVVEQSFDKLFKIMFINTKSSYAADSSAKSKEETFQQYVQEFGLFARNLNYELTIAYPHMPMFKNPSGKNGTEEPIQQVFAEPYLYARRTLDRAAQPLEFKPEALVGRSYEELQIPGMPGRVVGNFYKLVLRDDARACVANLGEVLCAREESASAVDPEEAGPSTSAEIPSWTDPSGRLWSSYITALVYATAAAKKAGMVEEIAYLGYEDPRHIAPEHKRPLSYLYVPSDGSYSIRLKISEIAVAAGKATLLMLKDLRAARETVGDKLDEMTRTQVAIGALSRVAECIAQCALTLGLSAGLERADRIRAYYPSYADYIDNRGLQGWQKTGLFLAHVLFETLPRGANAYFLQLLSQIAPDAKLEDYERKFLGAPRTGTPAPPPPSYATDTRAPLATGAAPAGFPSTSAVDFSGFDPYPIEYPPVLTPDYSVLGVPTADFPFGEPADPYESPHEPFDPASPTGEIGIGSPSFFTSTPTFIDTTDLSDYASETLKPPTTAGAPEIPPVPASDARIPTPETASGEVPTSDATPVDSRKRDSIPPKPDSPHDSDEFTEFDSATSEKHEIVENFLRAQIHTKSYRDVIAYSINGDAPGNPGAPEAFFEDRSYKPGIDLARSKGGLGLFCRAGVPQLETFNRPIFKDGQALTVYCGTIKVLSKTNSKKAVDVTFREPLSAKLSIVAEKDLGSYSIAGKTKDRDFTLEELGFARELSVFFNDDIKAIKEPDILGVGDASPLQLLTFVVEGQELPDASGEQELFSTPYSPISGSFANHYGGGMDEGNLMPGPNAEIVPFFDMTLPDILTSADVTKEIIEEVVSSHLNGYLNTSEEPNLEQLVKEMAYVSRVVLRATRDIFPGEQILLDYGKTYREKGRTPGPSFLDPRLPGWIADFEGADLARAIRTCSKALVPSLLGENPHKGALYRASDGSTAEHETTIGNMRDSIDAAVKSAEDFKLTTPPDKSAINYRNHMDISFCPTQIPGSTHPIDIAHETVFFAAIAVSQSILSRKRGAVADEKAPFVRFSADTPGHLNIYLEYMSRFFERLAESLDEWTKISVKSSLMTSIPNAILSSLVRHMNQQLLELQGAEQITTESAQKIVVESKFSNNTYEVLIDKRNNMFNGALRSHYFTFLASEQAFDNVPNFAFSDTGTEPLVPRDASLSNSHVPLIFSLFEDTPLDKLLTSLPAISARLAFNRELPVDRTREGSMITTGPEFEAFLAQQFKARSREEYINPISERGDTAKQRLSMRFTVDGPEDGPVYVTPLPVDTVYRTGSLMLHEVLFLMDQSKGKASNFVNFLIGISTTPRDLYTL